MAVGASLEDTVIVLHLIAKQIPQRYPNIRYVIPHLGGLISMQLERLDNQAPQQHQPKGEATPSGWSYQLDKNGNRIPKGNRVTNADGSWREEIRQGKCSTVKEMSAKGEYRETHNCGS